MLTSSPSPAVYSALDMTFATQIAPLRIGAAGIDTKDQQKDDTARWYGTRVATVILVKDDGTITFVERDRFKLENGEPVAGHGQRKEMFKV